MTLDWLRRDNELKDHALLGQEHFGTEAPSSANMNHEAYLGFNAFEAGKVTGKDVIDFVKYRQLVAEGALFDDKFAEQVLAKPKA